MDPEVRLLSLIRTTLDPNLRTASSDRRPVDPPPVVQLKVYDLVDGGKDVTMTYDSDFMLYASLEVARPIASGRMQSPPHPPRKTQ